MRSSLVPILLIGLANCSTIDRVACTSFGDPNLDEDEVAILRFTTASLDAINGNTVPLGRNQETFVCSDARLHPGLHTLTLRAEIPADEYEAPTGYIVLKQDLSFTAKPGHSYELNFALSDEHDFGVTWWIVETITSEVVAGMAVD
jgi:hypothetical protein